MKQILLFLFLAICFSCQRGNVNHSTEKISYIDVQYQISPKIYSSVIRLNSQDILETDLKHSKIKIELSKVNKIDSFFITKPPNGRLIIVNEDSIRKLIYIYNHYSSLGVPKDSTYVEYRYCPQDSCISSLFKNGWLEWKR